MRLFGEVCGRSSGDSAHRYVFCTETDPCSLRRLLMRANESGPESKSRDPGGGRARRCSGRVGPPRTGTDVSHTSGDVSVDAFNVFGTFSPTWPPSVWAWRSAGWPWLGGCGLGARHGLPEQAVPIAGVGFWDAYNNVLHNNVLHLQLRVGPCAREGTDQKVPDVRRFEPSRWVCCAATAGPAIGSFRERAGPAARDLTRGFTRRLLEGRKNAVACAHLGTPYTIGLASVHRHPEAADGNL